MENVERYGASKTKLETKTSTSKTWSHSICLPKTIHAEETGHVLYNDRV